MTNVISYSFGERELEQRQNKEKYKKIIDGIKSKLLCKTFEEIKNIVKNIGDHPNIYLLIDNLSKQKEYDRTITILADVIRNSTYSVDKILGINK